jgi:hypothetical protein
MRALGFRLALARVLEVGDMSDRLADRVSISVEK